MLEELHEGHPGICKIKALARSFVWGPGLNGDLENKVKGCEPCQLVRKSPAVAPLHPLEKALASWKCWMVHLLQQHKLVLGLTMTLLSPVFD